MLSEPSPFRSFNTCGLFFQAEQVEVKKKRTFKKYTYRGVDLDQLLDMSK